MYVSCCSIKFFLHGNRSLKEKRRIVRSLKDRLKNNFNVSVAEIGDQNLWQSLHMGVVAVNSDPKYLEGQTRKLTDAIEKMYLAEITDCQTQISRMSPEPS